MKNRKLLLIVSLVLAMMMSLGGTLAYLTDTDADVNVMTLGNVIISQNEQEWNADKTDLQPFTPDKPLLPYVGKLGWETVNGFGNEYRRFTMNNVVDKYVTVTNKGNTPAYVRTIIAAEMGGYENVADYRNTIVGFSRNEVDGADFDFPGAWVWDAPFVAQINDQNYMIMTATHQDALASKATTIPSLLQVYVNKDCDNEELTKVDGNKNGKLDILVISQAVQANGFTDANANGTAADEALTEAFEAVSADNVKDWFEKLVDDKGNIKDENLIGSPSNDGVNDKNDTNNPPEYVTPANIKAAMNAASEGDTILLTTGEYNLFFGPSVPKNLTLKGEGDVVATINVGRETPALTPEGLTFETMTIKDMVTQHQNTSVKNMTFRKCNFINSEIGFSGTTGIDGLTVEDCYFAGGEFGVHLISSAAAGVKNIVIKNNTFENLGYNAIQFGNNGVTGKVEITGNTIRNIGNRAMRLTSSTGANFNISNNTISNTYTDTTDDGYATDGNQVVKFSGTVTVATFEGNTYEGTAITLADGIALKPTTTP